MGAWIDDQYGGPRGWEELADGKAYFAIGALADAVKAQFFEETLPPQPTQATIYRERSLGSPRLDSVARSLRTSRRAELVTFRGQPGVRIEGMDGCITTSLLSQEELDALRRAGLVASASSGPSSCLQGFGIQAVSLAQALADSPRASPPTTSLAYSRYPSATSNPSPA